MDINISKSEWYVMEIVWKDQPITARGIMEYVKNDNDWSFQTLKTLINRLVKKQVLKFDKDGKTYIYSASIDKDEALKNEKDHLFSKFLNESKKELMTMFVKDIELDKDEIILLKKMLDEKESKNV